MPRAGNGSLRCSSARSGRSLRFDARTSDTASCTEGPYEQLMTVDYEYAAILEFDNVADLTAYLAHGAHDALGALFFEAFDVALMYDYEMQEGVAGVAALL